MRIADTVLEPKKVWDALIAQKQIIDKTKEFVPRYDAILALENLERYRAQSILTSLVPYPDAPTLAQARDILAWAKP